MDHWMDIDDSIETGVFLASLISIGYHWVLWYPKIQVFVLDKFVDRDTHRTISNVTAFRKIIIFSKSQLQSSPFSLSSKNYLEQRFPAFLMKANIVKATDHDTWLMWGRGSILGDLQALAMDPSLDKCGLVVATSTFGHSWRPAQAPTSGDPSSGALRPATIDPRSQALDPKPRASEHVNPTGLDRDRLTERQRWTMARRRSNPGTFVSS